MSKGTDRCAWGAGRGDGRACAHGDDKMACFTCHLSWTTSCGGCHLPIEANWKTDAPALRGRRARATSPPTTRRSRATTCSSSAGTARSRATSIAPVRSSSALVLSSTNINRERIYVQQPPISASASRARPSRRTTRTPSARPRPRPAPTATCRQDNDNNAIMAQLLLQGTNFVNFVGFNAWVGEEKRHRGGAGHRVGRAAGGDRQLPAPLRLSRLRTRRTRSASRELPIAHRARRGGATGCLQLRGEYLLRRRGQRRHAASTTSPASPTRASPSGSSPRRSRRWARHRTSRPTNATCVALPTNQPIDPDRNQGDLMRVDNQEQPFHPIYNYAVDHRRRWRA